MLILMLVLPMSCVALSGILSMDRIPPSTSRMCTVKVVMGRLRQKRTNGFMKHLRIGSISAVIGSRLESPPVS